MLPQHLSQYDIKHIITAVRSTSIQRIFDGNRTTITSLSHLIPALLKSLNGLARLPNNISQPHTQTFSDKFDRFYQSDRHVPRNSRDPKPADNSPKLPDSDRTNDAAPRRLNTVSLANHPKTVVLDPSDFVPICENCSVRYDHDTSSCSSSYAALVYRIRQGYGSDGSVPVTISHISYALVTEGVLLATIVGGVYSVRFRFASKSN